MYKNDSSYKILLMTFSKCATCMLFCFLINELFLLVIQFTIATSVIPNQICNGWLVGRVWLPIDSDVILETVPVTVTVPCDGREARFLHRSHRGLSNASSTKL